MSGPLLHIAMAQFDPRVGDIKGNADRILEMARLARDRDHADVLVTPELALVGHPLDDLLLRHGVSSAIAAALDRLTHELSGITVIVGYPEFVGDKVYDSAVVLRDGLQIVRYRKRYLDSRGVFDEHRSWSEGGNACVFDLGGYRLGVAIGADLYAHEPVEQAIASGAQMILGLEASPFYVGKQSERELQLSEQARDHGVPICCCNGVGGQDDVVFEGLSLAVDAAGSIVMRADAFETGVYMADWSAATSGTAAEPPDSDALVYDALVCATRDYVERNGFPGALLGASGGIDSALTMAIAADALGGERVWAVSMPSRYTADISNVDAADQAERLGVRYNEISVEQGFSALLDTLSPLFGDRAPDTAEENLQARIRGALLMSLSNKFGPVVLATGNKSEMAVGYSTLYGDLCGGFAPLKDVYKTQVYRLAKYRNAQEAVIPERVITRPPSAELRANQADADSLPEYDVLDAIIRAYVECDDSIQQIVETGGHDESTVRRVVNLIRRSEYKRRQSPPGPKVTPRAFGRDRRYPITAVYGDF